MVLTYLAAIKQIQILHLLKGAAESLFKDCSAKLLAQTGKQYSHLVDTVRQEDKEYHHQPVQLSVHPHPL
jgi:hypothetical protein